MPGGTPNRRRGGQNWKKGLNIKVLAHPGGFGREFSFFFPKNPHFRNQCKFLSIKTKHDLGRALKNVLTAKSGLFLGDLAGKQGFCALKKTLYFEFFRVFGIFCLASG
jgi:hypothetical protein